MVPVPKLGPWPGVLAPLDRGAWGVATRGAGAHGPRVSRGSSYRCMFLGFLLGFN